ncbi:MAG: hypothetical protein E8D49_12850 [Nitrospira sp.]|jgi:hypothetical protein|nr:MAG: hypothetical protein E8D49_12850 [Nitrospira sp.]
MPTNTVQVPVLMSHSQKLRLARKAKVAKLTMGELLRRGGERYSPDEDSDLLEQFARQVSRAAGKAIRSIDRTLDLVAESERRIQQLTRAASQRG